MDRDHIISVLAHLEVLFCLAAPVHLWGWEIGLLVFSGLTSLLHIVELLKATPKATP